jgi:hypothetical protein
VLCLSAADFALSSQSTSVCYGVPGLSAIESHISVESDILLGCGCSISALPSHLISSLAQEASCVVLYFHQQHWVLLLAECE